MLSCSLDSPTLALTEGSLSLRAPALLPLETAVQVASPLLARRPLSVDVVVVQEVPGAAAELPLGAVGFAGARRLPAAAVGHVTAST